MLHAGTNVLFHAEGGHYATHLEPPVKFEALNYQVAASVALQEGQNGLGTPLVNVDGSLYDHASLGHNFGIKNRHNPHFEKHPADGPTDPGLTGSVWSEWLADM